VGCISHKKCIFLPHREQTPCILQREINPVQKKIIFTDRANNTEQIKL